MKDKTRAKLKKRRNSERQKDNSTASRSTIHISSTIQMSDDDIEAFESLGIDIERVNYDDLEDDLED